VRPKRPAGPPTGQAAEALPGAETAAGAAQAGRPEVIARVLPNGTWLLLCPVPGHPTVSIQMFMRGGLSVESEKNAGLTQFMARLMMKGTAKRKADQIAAALDAMGAEMSTSSGRNSLTVSARCLAEDFEKTFDLAADCLLAPTFPKDEVELARSQILAELAQIEDTPQGEASLFFQRTFFADSPYRLPVQGTPEVVKALTREDLAAWHKQYVAGNNLVVAIFGGFDLVKEAHYAARAVEGLALNPALRFPKDVRARRAAGREVYVKPSAKGSAAVFVAYHGLDIYNIRDRFPMELLDTLTGGYEMPGGWLHEELRGKGLVYEVHTLTMEGLRPGYFAVYAVCQPAKVPEVVGVIEAAMKRATAETFSEADLVPARATILTAKQSARETIDGWAFEAALDQALGLGYDFPRLETQRLREVKPEDVSRVAREYLKAPVICITTSDPAAAEAVRKQP
jgi:zinc protease